MLLTPHFSLAELTTTRTGLPNTPGEAEVAKLRKVAEMLETIRAHFGRPIAVHSGYRSPAVNAAVGGSKTSQHMKAEAADFHVDGVALTEVFDWIRLHSGMRWSQLILEGNSPAHPTWLHIGLSDYWKGEPQQVLRFDGTRYSRVK
jgi:zinc D-Ala-D-Ala carboxypeptidase